MKICKWKDGQIDRSKNINIIPLNAAYVSITLSLRHEAGLVM